MRVLLAYLYKLTIKGYQNIKLEEINQIEGSVNELILYLNLSGKFKFKEVIYNIETTKALFKKSDLSNKRFMDFLQRLLKTMNKKNYPFLITIKTIKLWNRIKQIRFIFEKNKNYQEAMFNVDNKNIIVWENLKEDIKNYFNKKYSIELDESDISYLTSEISNQWISLSNFVKFLPANITKQKIFDIIEIIKVLNNLGENFSNEEKTRIIKNLVKNNRNLEYLEKWVKFVQDNSRIDSKKAYLISMIQNNAEPTEFKDNSKPKNFLQWEKVKFEINKIEI